SLTTQRDKNAFEELKAFVNLPANWIPQYYQDQEVSVYTNPQLAVASDTKIQIIKGFKCAVSQIELWNSEDFIKDHQTEIESTLRKFETEHWLFISPSIGEGEDYFLGRGRNFIREAREGILFLQFDYDS
ncbi:MAG: hypothetical protein QXH30_01090, partial [Candidatus Bilamarchaeaceae archaeon]